VSLPHAKSSRPSLEDFVLLKPDSTGNGVIIWSFNKQRWVSWDPKKMEKARALLWHGVFMVLKALYFCYHSFPEYIVTQWAPQEYTYLVYGKEEWATKLKNTQSHFHSYVLYRALTHDILKQWRALESYPKRPSSDKLADVLLSQMCSKQWFRTQAESDKEIFLTFTHSTSEVIDWELVYERKSIDDAAIYDLITESIASAAEHAFELGIDDPLDEEASKSHRGKTQRNEKWVQGRAPYPEEWVRMLPLKDIFGLNPRGSEAKDAVPSTENPNGTSLEDNLPESVSGIAGIGEAIDHSPEKREKRRRRKTQKAREAWEDSRKKRLTDGRPITAVPSPEPAADPFNARVCLAAIRHSPDIELIFDRMLINVRPIRGYTEKEILQHLTCLLQLQETTYQTSHQTIPRTLGERRIHRERILSNSRSIQYQYNHAKVMKS
jgi:hypothetical protein